VRAATLKKAASTLAFLFFLACAATPGRAGVAERLGALNLPPGFTVNVFSEGLDGPRLMAFGPSGTLYVTLTREGRVAALVDGNGNGEAEKTVVAASGLDRPHGIAFYRGHVYIAETGRVLRFGHDKKTLKFRDMEVVVPRLPARGGGHFTRTVAFGPDGKLYVSVGSSCNACVEGEKERAAVLRFNPDGSGKEIFAEGLRNPVGLVFHPATGEIFGTENGRDWLGDDLPPDEINVIKKGGHYGWPYCYGDGIHDPEFDKEDFCARTEPPVAEIQAHSAPLGLVFSIKLKFPPRYRGGLFVALHGSWNRTVPTGYKIIHIPFKDGRPAGGQEDFVTGWLRADGTKWGRPVDVVFDGKGDMFISDDYAGAVYRVSYKNR
jgi:glucose/arabinose dehydrogenase